MNGANQTIVDRRFAAACFFQPSVHGFQMAAHLGTQNIQQDRIHGNCSGLRRCGVLARRCNNRLNVRRRGACLHKRQRGQFHILARCQTISNCLHRRNIDRDLAFAQQGGV